MAEEACRSGGLLELPIIVTALFMSVGLGACAGGGAPDPGHIVRDSAGVTIVESSRAAWSGDSGWRIQANPILDIGVADGEPEYQFHTVEGALVLADGRIVVADGGASEIRFYDRSGTHVRSVGGQGDAPGEFRMISSMGVGPADSIWVYDYGNRRFSVLASNGDLIRTMSVGGVLSAVGAVGRLPTGEFVVKEGWGSPSSGSGREGLTRDPVAVVAISPDGSLSDTLGMFPGREVYVSVEDGRGVMSTPLFAHNTSATIRGAEVFVGVQDDLEVLLFSSSGALRNIYRGLNADLRLSDADIAAAKAEILSRQPDERRADMRRQLDGMAVPGSRPAYGRLLVATDGSLWAGEHARYPNHPRRWTVFSPEGVLLGEVDTPERFRLLQIGSDWVLGVGLDDLDVEHVQLLRLEK